MDEIVNNVKKNNHLYPALHLRKWKALKGKLIELENGAKRKIDDSLDFSSENYYSLGLVDDKLENRIASFEAYIGKLIKKIDDANKKVFLTGKEIEILKLYCFLLACRQHNTTEVVKNDESTFYESNNYVFGTPRISTQEDAVKITNEIMNDFDKLKKMKKETVFTHTHKVINPKENYGSRFTIGMHLAIFRNENHNIMVSDICCIIENTMDGDHLYTYCPVSPKTALVLVKTKYYLDLETLLHSQERLGMKYGGKPDPYLSTILGGHDKMYEWELLCSYYKYPSNVHSENNGDMLKQDKYKYGFVRIGNIPDDILIQYNRIFYEDGKMLIYINYNELERVANIDLNFREISLGW